MFQLLCSSEARLHALLGSLILRRRLLILTSQMLPRVRCTVLVTVPLRMRFVFAFKLLMQSSRGASTVAEAACDAEGVCAEEACAEEACTEEACAEE